MPKLGKDPRVEERPVACAGFRLQRNRRGVPALRELRDRDLARFGIEPLSTQLVGFDHIQEPLGINPPDESPSPLPTGRIPVAGLPTATFGSTNVSHPRSVSNNTVSQIQPGNPSLERVHDRVTDTQIALC